MSTFSWFLLAFSLYLFLKSFWGLPALIRVIYPPKVWKPQWPKFPRE